MITKLELLQKFLETLDDQGIWHVVLRNHHAIAEGVEKDIDLQSDAASYTQIAKIFRGICKQCAYIGKITVSGKSLFLVANPDRLSSESGEATDNAAVIHFVAFASVRNTALKYKFRGYSSRIRSWQMARERLEVGGLSCWAPTVDWRIVFLLEKMQQKKKDKYAKEILELIASEASQIGKNDDLLKHIKDAVLESASEACRLFAVKHTFAFMPKPLKPLRPLYEWWRVLAGNVTSKLRKKGLIIVFSGPDGAGKTTTKTNLIDYLSNDLKFNVVSLKGLNPLNNPGSMGKLITKAQHQVRGVADASGRALEFELRDRAPKGKSFSWKMRRFLGLLFILAQYPFGYLSARIQNYQGKVVVIDTSVFDRFIKAHRPRYRMLERIMVPLLPVGDVVFRLYAAPNVIVARKPELTVAELDDYYATMDEVFAIKKNSNIQVVVTENGPTSANAEVQAEVVRLLQNL